jgi:hypothetical protein
MLPAGLQLQIHTIHTIWYGTIPGYSLFTDPNPAFAKSSKTDPAVR